MYLASWLVIVIMSLFSIAGISAGDEIDMEAMFRNLDGIKDDSMASMSEFRFDSNSYSTQHFG